MPPPSSSPPKPLIAATVAIFVILSSVAEGGYSVESRAVLAILVWSALLAGLALGLFPRSRIPNAALVTGTLLGGLALLTAVSVAWASDDGAAIQEAVRVSAYVGLLALVVCASREGEARSWLGGLAAGIVAVAALALLSRLIPGLPGGDEEITQFLPAAQGRLSYPIGYWNALAALLALGVVLLAWFGASGRTLLGRVAAVGAIPMLGLGIYLASSRGGFAALLVGLIALVAIGPRRPVLLASAMLGALGTGLAIPLASGQTELLDATTGDEASAQGAALLMATVACMLFTGVLRAVLDGPLSRAWVTPSEARASLAVAGVALLALIVVANPSERFEEFKSVPEAESRGGGDLVAAHLESGSGSGRWQFWDEAVDAFAAEPLHGLGAGAYGTYWNQHAPIEQTVTQAHSLYLEQLAELGLLGLLGVVGFLLVGTIRGIRNSTWFDGGEAGALAAVVAAGALSAGIDWTWEVPATFAPVVIALALLSGPAMTPEFEGKTADPNRSVYGWGIALLVLGWISLVLAGGSLLTERNLNASRDAAGDGDLERAVEEARDAVALQPWAAEPRLQLALSQEASGELDAAEASIGEAIDRAPEDWSLWIVRSRIATLDSRLKDADEAYEQARTLNPRAPIFSGLRGPLAPEP